jgi:hypothetical protein
LKIGEERANIGVKRILLIDSNCYVSTRKYLCFTCNTCERPICRIWRISRTHAGVAVLSLDSRDCPFCAPPAPRTCSLAAPAALEALGRADIEARAPETTPFAAPTSRPLLAQLGAVVLRAKQPTLRTSGSAPALDYRSQTRVAARPRGSKLVGHRNCTRDVKRPPRPL